jgi:predicted helicase
LGMSGEEIFHYIYAVFFGQAYRRRYLTFLKIDFPRLPLPGSRKLFRDLGQLGAELTALHLMTSPKLDKFVTTYSGPNNPKVSRISWSNDTVWLDAAATKKGQTSGPGTVGFRGVPAAVWNFHIGGYQICEKWLKDRKDRTLSDEELVHYQKIIVSLDETVRLMKDIDQVIETHGGWPGAFDSTIKTSSDRQLEARF